MMIFAHHSTTKENLFLDWLLDPLSVDRGSLFSNQPIWFLRCNYLLTMSGLFRPGCSMLLPTIWWCGDVNHLNNGLKEEWKKWNRQVVKCRTKFVFLPAEDCFQSAPRTEVTSLCSVSKVFSKPSTRNLFDKGNVFGNKNKHNFCTTN